MHKEAMHGAAHDRARLKCIVEGCERNAHARKMCKRHRVEAMANGTIRQVRFASPLASFNARVAKSEGCWEWVGAKSREGYGQIFGGNLPKQRGYAHRWSYEYFVGPIPEGLQIDHLCRNRGCVNPAHLEPVTQRENVLRGEGTTAVRARQDECVHGHPFDEANTYIRRDTGARLCRACSRERRRRHG